MPRNGTGTYSLPQPPFVAGTVISSAAVNSDLSNIAAALTASLPRDGQAGMTGQLKASDGSSIAPSYSFTNETNTGFFRDGTGMIGIVIQGVKVGDFTSAGLIAPVQSGVPVGTVVDFAGSSIPTLWYLCYGQAVSRNTYATLFTATGTTYGSGDGITTFNLPDYRGTFGVGKDDMGGSAAGRLTTTYFGTSPIVLGNQGGAQSTSLITSNLPAYTPSGSVSTSTNFNFSPATIVNGGGFAGLCGTGAQPFASSGQYAQLTVSSSSSFSGSAQGGSSTAFANVPPALIVNKIIYAGA